MLTKIKDLVRKTKDGMIMPMEFLYDYKSYKKWNYHNRRLNSQNSLEAKILRQTHILEKGMSLSNSRKGFGQEKINTLFEFCDEYISAGYTTDSIAFQNSILALKRYIEFQRNMDYKNPELEKRISNYEKYITQLMEAGISHYSIEEIMSEAHGEFPQFYQSRHSIRQFDNTEINLETLKEAVRLAQKAPSACNRQSCKVYYFNSTEINKELGNLIAGNTGFATEVQKYLVVTSDMSAFYDTFERNQIYVDGGIFVLSLVEALHYYGIGSCILQNGERKEKDKAFRSIMNCVSDNEKIIVFVAIGNYRKEFNTAVSQRKPLDEVLKIIYRI